MAAALAAACSGAKGPLFAAADAGADTANRPDAAEPLPPLDRPPPADASAEDAAPPATDRPLLARYPGCPSTLFDEAVAAQDFTNAAAYAVNWRGAWAAPSLQDGALVFGPHPMSPNWWENYSPTTSTHAFPDPLACARIRMTRDDRDDAWSNSFELTVRLAPDAPYETAGMTLLVLVNAGELRLRTRTGDSAWTTYDAAPLKTAAGSESTFDLLLFAQGPRFFAQARNVDSSETADLRATAVLPAGDLVSLLGWRNRAAARVDRLVLGPAAASIARELESRLP